MLACEIHNIVVILHISGKPGDVTGTGGNYGSMAPGVRPMDDNRRKFLCFFICFYLFIILKSP